MKKSVVGVQLQRHYCSIMQTTILTRSVDIRLEGKISDSSLLHDVDIRHFHILKRDTREYCRAYTYRDDCEWRAGKDVAAKLLMG